MASNVYTPPGVSVQEFTDPSITPLLATPVTVCLVGPSTGILTKTDVVKLTGTTATTLPGIPTDATMAADAILKVIDAVTPSIAPEGYILDTDFEFDETAHTITRDSGGDIPNGNTVYVTYEYTPADYFLPIRMDNMADIENRFGTAYDSTGTSVNSPLTFAAALAFENGASDVVLQPLYHDNSGTREQPTNNQIATASVWATNYVGLRDIVDINVLVPISGQNADINDATQLAILQAAQDHTKFMRDNSQYVMLINGEDSTTSTSLGQAATLRAHATTLAARYGGSMAQQTVLVSPGRYSRFTPSGAATLLSVGGQYMAAAIAGMIAARPVSASLTRKAVSGFSAVGEVRSKAEKNLDAAAGLLVTEDKGGLVRIRHAVTTDVTRTTQREISIVRAKHRVIESLQDTIETQIIGEVIADGEAPFVVRSAVIGVLEELRLAQDIVDYSDVQARTKSLDPTEIEVRFSYRPAFPVNYVTIGFTLDLTAPDSTVINTNLDTSTF